MLKHSIDPRLKLVFYLILSIGLVWLIGIDKETPAILSAQSPVNPLPANPVPSGALYTPSPGDIVVNALTVPRAPTATPTRIPDDQPPVTTLSLAGSYNANGWTQSSVTATFNATDDMTGLSITWYKVSTEPEYHHHEYHYPPAIITAEGKLLYYYSEDKNSNWEDVHTATINLDTTAPTVSHTIEGELLPNGSYSSPVTVVLNGQDNLSGIDYYQANLNNTGWQVVTSSLTIADTGHQELIYKTIDLAGNISALGTASFDIGMAAPTTIGEVGYLNDTLTHTPKTILFSQFYVNPVVFAQPVSLDGGHTSVIRITDVQADRFTLYVHEAPNRDGPHTTEAVSYLVLEAGSWELPDGTQLEVGELSTSATVGNQVSNQWTPVIFNNIFPSTPVVVSQVQSNNDPHWVKTRQQSISTIGFDVALEEEEAKTTNHGSESIGWFAITPGQGTWDGHLYEAGQTGDTVTSSWTQLTFGQTFSQAPRFIGGLATYDEADGAYPRYSRSSLTTTGVQIKLEEDTTWDGEKGHTTEVVHYLAIEGDGTLTVSSQ